MTEAKVADPLSLLTSAVVGGAAVLANGAISAAANDLYSSLKGLIRARFAGASLKGIEDAPSSDQAIAKFTSAIRRSGQPLDPEIMRVAKELLDLLNRENPAILSKVRVTISGSDNTYAASGGVAVGGHAKNVTINLHKEFADRISSYSAMGQNRTPKTRFPPQLRALAIGIFFCVFAFVAFSFGSHPLNKNAGAYIGLPALVVGLGALGYGLFGLFRFVSSGLLSRPAGVVSVHVEQKGESTVTLQFADESRKEFIASARTVRALTNGDVGIAHTRGGVLIEFQR